MKPGDAEPTSESFFGLHRDVAPKLNGTIIDCTGQALTPEIVDEACRLILERSTLAPCESPDGTFHHFAHPAYGNICFHCGWDLKKVIRY